MEVNIKKLLSEAGLEEENMYPGKRAVKRFPHGEFKSHSLELNWLNPHLFRWSVHAGLSGHTLPAKELKKYPVSFQTPTYVEIETDLESKRADEDEGEEGRGGKTSGGGGGKSPQKKSLRLMSEAFGTVVEGKIPEVGKIVDMMVMGMKISEKAYGAALEVLAHQVKAMKIVATEILAHAGNFVTKYTPPAFLQPKGDEDKVYKYSREKNEIMFGGMGPR